MTVASGNILLSSAGRRVGLLACIRDSIFTSGASRQVFAIDSVSSAPAAFFGDSAWPVPRCTDPNFLDRVLDLLGVPDSLVRRWHGGEK